jgi:hypothetical protein
MMEKSKKMGQKEKKRGRNKMEKWTGGEERGKERRSK